jgi:UDP-N-acetylglucosamine acyltransferase
MTNVHPTAIIDDGAELGDGVQVGAYSVIGPNVRIGAGTRVHSHVVIDGMTTIGEACTFYPFACIGTQTQDLKFSGGETSVEIGDRSTFREYVTVNSGTHDGEVTRVGSDCTILAYCHVAHACAVGNEVIMSNGATLAGDVIVEDQAIIGGLTGVHQFTRIGRLCMVGGCTKIVKDCAPFMIVDGNPGQMRGVNVIGMERRGIEATTRDSLKKAYRLLFRKGLSTQQALEEIAALEMACPEVDHLVAFVKNSNRGIVK